MTKFKNRLMGCLLTVLLCTTAFSTTAFAGGPDYVEPVEEPVTEEAIEPGEPLSEDSDISTRDLLYDKATNKQFITITDRDGNIFYLVIDYDSPVSEDEEQYKTYFLNPVDTDDLKALAEEAETKPIACTCTKRCVAGAIDMDCPVCASDMTECAGKVPEPIVTEKPVTEEPVDTKPVKGGTNPALLIVLVLALAGGGVFAYMKFFKSKPKTKGSADLDDYDYDDEEDEETEDTPWESEDEVPEPDEKEPDKKEPDEETVD